MSGMKKRYIPGLSGAEDKPLTPERPGKNTPKVVSHELMDDFLASKKNPISALYEYCAAKKFTASFEEAPVEVYSLTSQFACVCKVNGRPFPQGAGATKKEAKTNAATKAFTAMLGLDKADMSSHEDYGQVTYDAMGRKMILNKDVYACAGDGPAAPTSIAKSLTKHVNPDLSPVIDLPVAPAPIQPKHPVSQLQEHCQRNEWTVRYAVTDKKTPEGFRAIVYVEDDEFGIAFADNKKDAKKIAAEMALKKLNVDIKYNQDVEAHQKAVAEAMAKQPTPAPVPEHAAHDSAAPKLQELQRYCAAKGIPYSIEVSDNPGPKGYRCIFKSGNDVVQEYTGKTKKEAKAHLAQIMLDLLLPAVGDYDNEKTELQHYDQMAALSHNVFKHTLETSLRTMGMNQQIFRSWSTFKVLAVFIIKRDLEDRGDVVAMGTGHCCVSPDARLDDGRTLYDSHAVVVAKRALQKYLYQEIKFFKEGNVIQSIFQQDTDYSKFKMKEHVSLHLYMSTAPCGDASCHLTTTHKVISPEEVDLQHDGAHYPDYESSDGAMLRVKAGPGDETYTIEQAYRSGMKVFIMSCSDKLLKWNILGLQGALLSQLVEPIYLNSMTLGNKFDHSHLTRAVCCRLDNTINDSLPEGYRLNHPYLGRTSFDMEYEQADKMDACVINWSKGDSLIEVLHAAAGKSIEKSPFRTSQAGASRLCKAGFLHRFKETCKLLRRHELLNFGNYAHAKQNAVAYNKAKTVMRDGLESYGVGRWMPKNPKLGDCFGS